MKKLIIVLLLAGFSAAEAQSDRALIKSVLDKQVAAWNVGDIETFMETYWKSDSLVYIGSTGLRYGWQNALDGYKERYPDKKTMGQVTFDIHKMNRLSEDFWFVIGSFDLKREVGDLSGFFTLLFRKVEGKWLIVADHSS